MAANVRVMLEEYRAISQGIWDKQCQALSNTLASDAVEGVDEEEVRS